MVKEAIRTLASARREPGWFAATGRPLWALGGAVGPGRAGDHSALELASFPSPAIVRVKLR